MLPLLGMILAGLAIYFIPSAIAISRNHHNQTAILALNFIFGWTVLGWAACFIWALTTPAPTPQYYIVQQAPPPLATKQ